MLYSTLIAVSNKRYRDIGLLIKQLKQYLCHQKDEQLN